MSRLEKLVIPSCSGLLDCFNLKKTKFSMEESKCCLDGEGDNLLLLGLFSFLYLTRYSLESCEYTFKISEFKRYIRYVGGGNSKDIPHVLEELQSMGYSWNQQNFSEVVKVTLNQTRTVATVESNYFLNLMKQMATYNGSTNKYGKKVGKGKSSYSSMIYTSILKERNHAATEVAIELVKAIERRGALGVGEDLHIKVGTLLQRCPTLYSQVTRAKEKKEKNRICKVAISKGIELLKKHTALYDHFTNLKISFLENQKVSEETIISINYLERLMLNEEVL